MSIYAFSNPVYLPAMRVILTITNANPAVITTSLDGINPANHNYITGTIVRLDIPAGFGMSELNQTTGTITVLSPTTFSMNIDTTNINAYTVPPAWPENFQLGQVVPIGEDNSILTAAVKNNL